MAEIRSNSNSLDVVKVCKCGATMYIVAVGKTRACTVNSFCEKLIS